MMTEGRSAVVWGIGGCRGAKEHEGVFWDNGNVLHLGCNGG